MKAILALAALAVFATGATQAAVQPSGQTTVSVETVKTNQEDAKRKKRRVPGGSGCDSARDRAEHPECRV